MRHRSIWPAYTQEEAGRHSFVGTFGRFPVNPSNPVYWGALQSYGERYLLAKNLRANPDCPRNSDYKGTLARCQTNLSFVFLPSIGVLGGCKMTDPIARFDDRTLIKLAVAGQAECFSVLMNRHGTAVKRYIEKIVKNRSDVEDIVQDTFLKAWLSLSTFRFESNFRTWVTRVAINEVLALYRRQRCRPFCPEPANFDTFRSSCGSPDEALARSEARRTVRSAIAELPEKYREILILCELEQLSMDEAARQLKSSISLVKTRLFRARHMLSAAVNKYAA